MKFLSPAIAAILVAIAISAFIYLVVLFIEACRRFRLWWLESNLPEDGCWILQLRNNRFLCFKADGTEDSDHEMVAACRHNGVLTKRQLLTAMRKHPGSHRIDVPSDPDDQDHLAYQHDLQRRV